ncbi:MAG: hypothetical protein M1819_002936 [Sarea resinae]|nr:MAG: hypothetical protein M1819_002936 [Sarea resinae]
MPPSKRKRSSSINTPSTSDKRVKGASTDSNHQITTEADASAVNSSPEEESSSGPFWNARCILNERAGKFQVDWEDNEVTGEKYSPTWEPRRHLGAGLLEDWNQKKKEKREQKAQLTKARRSLTRAPKRQSNADPAEEATLARASKRLRRRVPSSSQEEQATDTPIRKPIEEATAEQSSSLHDHSPLQPGQEVEVQESQSQEIQKANEPPHAPALQIEVPEPPDRNQYPLFSSLFSLATQDPSQKQADHQTSSPLKPQDNDPWLSGESQESYQEQVNETQAREEVFGRRIIETPAFRNQERVIPDSQPLTTTSLLTSTSSKGASEGISRWRAVSTRISQVHDEQLTIVPSSTAIAGPCHSDPEEDDSSPLAPFETRSETRLGSSSNQSGTSTSSPPPENPEASQETVHLPSTTESFQPSSPLSEIEDLVSSDIQVNADNGEISLSQKNTPTPPEDHSTSRPILDAQPLEDRREPNRHQESNWQPASQPQTSSIDHQLGESRLSGQETSLGQVSGKESIAHNSVAGPDSSGTFTAQEAQAPTQFQPSAESLVDLPVARQAFKDDTTSQESSQYDIRLHTGPGGNPGVDPSREEIVKLQVQPPAQKSEEPTAVPEDSAAVPAQDYQEGISTLSASTPTGSQEARQAVKSSERTEEPSQNVTAISDSKSNHTAEDSSQFQTQVPLSLDTSTQRYAKKCFLCPKARRSYFSDVVSYADTNSEIWQSGQATSPVINSIETEPLQVISGSQSTDRSSNTILQDSGIAKTAKSASSSAGLTDHKSQPSNGTNLVRKSQFSETLAYSRPEYSSHSSPIFLNRSANRDIRTVSEAVHSEKASAPLRSRISSDDELRSQLAGIIATPSRQTMPDSSIRLADTPGATLRERIENMRARTIAERDERIRASLGRPYRFPDAGQETASPSPPVGEESPQSVRDPTKSPSVIPEKAPEQAPPSLEASGPPHLPFTPAHPSHLALHKEVSREAASLSGSLGRPELGKMEFVVPLPMDFRVRDQYEQVIFNYRDEIEKFTSVVIDSGPERFPSQRENAKSAAELSQPELIDVMKEMIERVNNVTNHADMENNGTLTQQDVSAEEEAKWAESCSSKFKFLRRFIDLSRSQEIHVAILAQSGRLLDIIEKFLQGNHVVYDRPDRYSQSDLAAQGPLNVSLLATGEAGASAIVSTASLVIAFDGSFNAEDRHVRALRSHMFNVGQLSPAISLVITNSAEHIEKCLPHDLAEDERLQALVGLIAQRRHAVGVLPADTLPPTAAADRVVEFLAMGGLEEQWPLPPIGELAGLQSDPESHVSGSEQSTSSGEAQSQTTEVKESRKRGSSTVGDLEPGESKKARPEQPSQSIDAGGVEVTHISDSLGDPTQTSPQQAGRKIVLNVVESKTRSSPHSTTREAGLSQQLRETTLKLHKAEANLQGYEQALSDLQYRFEDQTTALDQLRREHTSSLATVTNLLHRIEVQKEEISKLKDGQSSLRIELQAAREDLKASPDPNIALIASQKEEICNLSEEKKRLTNSLKSTAADFDFTRTQYQNASNAAADAAVEVSQLKSSLETSERRLRNQDEARRLEKHNHDAEMATHVERIDRLETECTDRDELIRRLQEENVRLRGRGVTTRASSRPRSPVPGPAAGGRYSRGSSPNVAGYLPHAGVPGSGNGNPKHPSKHPLRNNC